MKASFGHVSDLPQKTLGIDVKNDFAVIFNAKEIYYALATAMVYTMSSYLLMLKKIIK